MVSTYPLLVVCGRGVLENLIPLRIRCPSRNEANNENSENQEWSKTLRCSITLLWFATTLLLSTAISNLAIVIEYLGALACANIFIFPGDFKMDSHLIDQ